MQAASEAENEDKVSKGSTSQSQINIKIISPYQIEETRNKEALST